MPHSKKNDWNRLKCFKKEYTLNSLYDEYVIKENQSKK
jgi:hypothetical protein